MNLPSSLAVSVNVSAPIDRAEERLRTDEAVRRLDQLLDLLGERGVRWRKSRFDRYRRLLLRAVTEPLTAFEEKDRLAYFEAAHQVYTLTDSAQWWGVVDRFELNRRLARVLRGGLMGARGQEHDEPRNILFEIALATRLHKCGFALHLKEPDLIAERPDLPRALAIACKRPTSAQKPLQSNLEAALRQLRGRPDGIGVIAIDVVRQTGLDQAARDVGSETEADEEIRDRIRFILTKVAELLKQRRIALFPAAEAFILFCSCPFWIEDRQAVYLPSVASLGVSLPAGDPRLAGLERDLNRAFEGTEPVWTLTRG